MTGVGIGFSFVPISIAALAGVKPAEAGLASGLTYTSQQIGGALGIATLATIATSRTQDSLVSGCGPARGHGRGFLVGLPGGCDHRRPLGGLCAGPDRSDELEMDVVPAREAGAGP